MKNLHFPRIGQRIIKSAVGVFICYLIYFITGRDGIPFYSMIAVLCCIQPYTNKTIQVAMQRATGTLIGAFFGLITILIEIYALDIYDSFIGYLLNASFIIPIIYATVLMHRQDTSYLSCVVYLSIAVNHITDANPFIFVGNRVIDTFIGIAVGIAVNNAHIPRRKVHDSLFIVALDDMISPLNEEMSAYSKIEINRMLDDGMNFTIATMRTPASVMKPVNGVNLNLPIIVMDGAALYDIKENSFMNAYIISNESSSELVAKIRSEGMNCFINALCDNTLIIFYSTLVNDAENDIVARLRCSPYRVYVQREPSESDHTVYIMILDKTEKITDFYNKLCDEGYDSRFKITCYRSDVYSGYSHMRIYNKNACTDNMIRYLMQSQKVNNKITIGNGTSNDIQTKNKNLDDVIKALKNAYELPFFK